MSFQEVITLVAAAAFIPAIITLIYFFTFLISKKLGYKPYIKKPTEFMISMIFATIALLLVIVLRRNLGALFTGFFELLFGIMLIVGLIYHYTIAYREKKQGLKKTTPYIACYIILIAGFIVLVLLGLQKRFIIKPTEYTLLRTIVLIAAAFLVYSYLTYLTKKQPFKNPIKLALIIAGIICFVSLMIIFQTYRNI